MKDAPPLPYASPATLESRSHATFGWPLCTFIAVSGLLILAYGADYIRAWHAPREWHVAGNEGDLRLGIGACVIGVTLVGVSVYLFWRKSSVAQASEKVTGGASGAIHDQREELHA
jgi:hypothetical protein